MRKKSMFKFVCIAALLMVVCGCRKEPVLPETVRFSAEKVSVTTTTATYQVTYSDASNIGSVAFLVYADEGRSELVALNAAVSSITGINRLKIVGLEANTTYYYQFRLSNKKYESVCGHGAFTTMDYSAPVVTTKTIISSSSFCSATCGGTVEDDGGSKVVARGVCWSTSPNPTIEDDHTVDYSEMQSYTSQITGLMACSTYYVRAYATNGVGTGYGNERKFSNNTININVNGCSFKIIGVEGGTFTMGATSEQGDDTEYEEKPAHQVTLSSFAIGQTEVTQGLWKAVMGEPYYLWETRYGLGDSYPAYYVDYYDIQRFIIQLNALTEMDFRLPTEAEWEYAARGGKKSKGYKYSGSNNISSVAWYNGNHTGGAHPVGQKAPNELGLYDMSGNLRERVQDWYGSYNDESQLNPLGPDAGTRRVIRGGYYCTPKKDCRVSSRYRWISDSNNDLFTGFRIALQL